MSEVISDDGGMSEASMSEGGGSPKKGSKKRGRCVRVMWKEKLRLLKGTTPAAVLEKEILDADVCKRRARLILPEKSLEALLELMTDAEKRAAEGEGAPLLLLDRKGDEYPETRILRLEGAGEYAIAGQWLEVVKNNQFRAGEVVDVFCFRVPPTPSGAAAGEWRLGLAVCSRVAADKMARRLLGIE